MRIIYRFLFFVFCISLSANYTIAQNAVGINTLTPNKNSVLELISPNHNQGLLIPKLTTAQRTDVAFIANLSATENGLMVYDSDENIFYFWKNPSWQKIGSGQFFTAGSGIIIAQSTATISAIDNSATNEIQDLSLNNNTLKITNNTSATTIDLSKYIQHLSKTGNSISLSSDEPSISISTNTPSDGQVLKWNGTANQWEAQSDNGNSYTAGTGIAISQANVISSTAQAQDLTLNSNILKITNNASASPIDLSGYQQDLSFTNNLLTITKNSTATPINLSSYIQDLSLTNNSLKITNNSSATAIDLSSYVQDLSLSSNKLKITNNTNATQIDLSGYQQDLSFTNNLLKITNSPSNSSVDLSAYIQDLTLVNNKLKITNNTAATSIDLSSYVQDLSFSNNQLKITNNTLATVVNLSGYQQDLSLNNNALKITNNPTATAIDLSAYTQDLTLSSDILKITKNSAASSIDLSTYKQDISKTGNTISLSGDATPISISTNTPTNGLVLKWNGTAAQWEALTDNNTQYAAGNGIDVTGSTISAKVSNSTLTSDANGLKVSQNGISSNEIVNGAVTTGKIADLSVTGAKIQLGGEVNGDLMYYNGTTWARLATGLNGQVLQSNGSSTTPIWVTLSSPTSTAQSMIIDASAGTTSVTADASGIHFKYGGVEKMFFNGTSLEFSNTNIFVGQSVAKTGTNNTYLGANAGSTHATCTDNVAIGYQVGKGNGSLNRYNTFVGSMSGTAITTGNNNAFFGYNAGNSFSTGFNNTYIGFQAGKNATSGSDNNFFGNSSGLNNIFGNYNLFMGGYAGNGNTMGSNNIFIGDHAGYTNDKGNNNVALGYKAGYSLFGTGSNNNVFLGYQAGYYETSSNKLYIENSNATSAAALIYGEFDTDKLQLNANVGVGGVADAVFKLYVYGDIKANSVNTSSDRRFKLNISPLQNSLQKVLQLQGVTYNWNTTKFPERNFSNRTQIGMIAQDVETVVPELVTTENDGYKSISYSNTVALLVEAIKEQQKLIDKQSKEIESLKAENKKYSNLEGNMKTLQEQVEILKQLIQNQTTLVKSK